MKLFHVETSKGKVTRVQHNDENGHPMASSFPGWLDKYEITKRLEYCKKHDRNNVPTAEPL